MAELQEQIDIYGRKILFELDKNARLSATAIGKKIRKSKQFVDYRIKKLEKLRILSNYVTVIDYSKLGYQSIRIYFKLHNITTEQQKELENDLIKDKEVWWFVSIQGHWDIAYAMAVKDILEFYSYWDKVMAKYRKYIKDNLIVVYTHITQYPKAFLIGKKNNEAGTTVGASKKIEIDSFDLRLLKILSDQARMPLLELAQKLDTSPQVVRNHIKKLEKNKVIQGYRASIDVSFLGYRYYKSYLNFLNTDRLKELQQFCLEHPNIMNINRTIGFRDFEIELLAQNFQEFEAIMDEIRDNFKGMIDDFIFIIARKEKKMVYFPFE
ncbi:Lrp/AsnC family transcriptional regulator [Candidatus Woesearchaeota archaeon]|nr:Lrp/AsnC family transcriptional regulator [Candidatus Woesearchaeota archaeon]